MWVNFMQNRRGCCCNTLQCRSCMCYITGFSGCARVGTVPCCSRASRNVQRHLNLVAFKGLSIKSRQHQGFTRLLPLFSLLFYTNVVRGARFFVAFLDQAVELDKVEHGDAIQDALQSITGQRSVPNVFIGGSVRETSG